MEKQKSEIRLIAHPEDAIPIAQAALLGFQHVLAMSVYIVPFLIASVLALNVQDSASFIQSAFVATGLATLIQSQLCMRFPIVQGPSFVPIGAVLAIAFAAGGGVNGFSAVAGALIPGALVITLLGWPTRLFHRLVNRFVPPIVGGTIIIVVGIALMPVALQESIFATHGGATLGGNIILSLVSATVLVGFMLAGIAFGARATWLRLFSVILALGVGCALAAAMGRLDLSAVGRAAWFSLPWIAFVTLDVHFSFPAALTMGLVYIVVMAETTGTWFALSAVLDKPLSDEQMDRGAMGEGLGCLVSALLCSVPVTGYSTNAGIIAITGIASRIVFAAAGVLLALFGLIGKLSALIASIPGAVIGGVFSILCVVIAMNGFRIIRHIPMTERNMLVIGLPILMALFATLMPRDFLKTLPDFVQYVLGSSIAFGALWAIILQKLLPALAPTPANEDEDAGPSALL